MEDGKGAGHKLLKMGKGRRERRRMGRRVTAPKCLPSLQRRQGAAGGSACVVVQVCVAGAVRKVQVKE